MANDQTIIKGAAQNQNVAPAPVMNPAPAVAKTSLWKPIAVGGMTGIMMGAGGLMGAQAIAANHVPDQAQADEAAVPGDLHVAQVSDELSFSEAFAAARAQVGPGGVFEWHGAIFNTYYADEWDALSDEQKEAFAQLVQPEIPVDNINAEHIAETHVTYVTHNEVHHHHESVAHNHHAGQQQHENHNTPDDNHNTADVSGFEQEGVHIVGQTTHEGHVVVAYDLDDDNQADLVLIDVDDSHDISGVDVLVDADGNKITVAELIEDDMSTQDQNNEILAQNPDVAPDGMPDYMDDGLDQA